MGWGEALPFGAVKQRGKQLQSWRMQGASKYSKTLLQPTAHGYSHEESLPVQQHVGQVEANLLEGRRQCCGPIIK